MNDTTGLEKAFKLHMFIYMLIDVYYVEYRQKNMVVGFWLETLDFLWNVECFDLNIPENKWLQIN